MESPVSDLELLRLVQRTGPVIRDLAPDTTNRILGAFHQLLCEGTAVARILPWLWQLSEPENSTCAQQVPDSMKEKLVEVIQQLSHEAPDHQVGLHKVAASMLVSPTSKCSCHFSVITMCLVVSACLLMPLETFNAINFVYLLSLQG